MNPDLLPQENAKKKQKQKQKNIKWRSHKSEKITLAKVFLFPLKGTLEKKIWGHTAKQNPATMQKTDSRLLLLNLI